MMAASDLRFFPCTSCGGDLEFRAGTQHLICTYCGTDNHIEVRGDAIEELGFQAFLQREEARSAVEERLVVECNTCGGQSVFDTNITGDRCDFCGSRIVAQARSTKTIRPRSLLPFKVVREQAVELFHNWLAGLWFAPNTLKKLAQLAEKLAGIYVPFWTYDCKAVTLYKGERGVKHGSGEDEQMKWTPVTGRVETLFDDLVVPATEALPRKQADLLEPWDLENLVPYDERFLSGFKVKSYTTPLVPGFELARSQMEGKIRETIRGHIGGDNQRIGWVKTGYSDITFKHVLLPVWVSAYRFKGKTYRLLINGRTGEVQGERPWSWIKIALTALVTVLTVWALYSYGPPLVQGLLKGTAILAGMVGIGLVASKFLSAGSDADL